MAEFNYKTIIYLFLRLIPFILVCFFTLSSVFNRDFVGLIYLGGLLIACFFNIIIGEIFPRGETNEMCDLITINNNVLFSNLPIGLTIISYTFFYLLYMIIQYDFIRDNMTSLVIFPLFIISDVIWNINNNCFSILNIILSIAVGGSIGYGWSALLDYGKIKNFHFINSLRGSNRKGQTCGALKNEGKMNCFVYKNGNLLGNLDPNLLSGGDDDGSGRKGRKRKGGDGDGTGGSGGGGTGSGDDDIGCN